jgi:hypothetical protein
MDGLLGNGWEDPRSAAMMAAAAGLLRRDLAGGLLGANEAFAQAQMNKRRMGLLDAQLEETKAQAQERAMRVAAAQAEAQRLSGIQQGLPGLYRQPGFSGGEAQFPTMGDQPLFSLPATAAPMRATPGGFDVQRAITELRMKPEEAEAYFKLSQLGKPKVARTLEVMRGGKPVTIQLDESGQEIGGAYDQWKAPVFQNLGNRVAALDPVALGERGSFSVGMSPEGRDASARGWAGHTLAQQRFNLEAGNAVADAGGPSQVGLVRQFGKAAPGYRWKQDGTQEAIPGGPADIKAGSEAEKAKQRAAHAVGQADVVIGTIDDAIGKVGRSTTGLTGAALGVVPGTTAYDLRKTVDTVKANIGFDTLQKMREMSPTGGALGQVAVQELNMLQATLGNLDPNQSRAEVDKKLQQVRTHYENWKRVMEQQAGSTGGASGGWDDPLKLRGGSSASDPLGIRKK